MNIKETENKYFTDTKMLLKHYREIQLCVNCRSFDNKEVNDIIGKGNKQMLEVLRRALEKMQTSKNKKENQYYKVLWCCYLSLDEYTDEEIMKILELDSKRTLYRQRKQAIEALSVILWGSNAIKDKYWKEISINFARLLPASILKKIIKEKEPDISFVKSKPPKKYKRNGILYFEVNNLEKTGIEFQNQNIVCPSCNKELSISNVYPITNGKLNDNFCCPECNKTMNMFIAILYTENEKGDIK